MNWHQRNQQRYYSWGVRSLFWRHAILFFVIFMALVLVINHAMLVNYPSLRSWFYALVGIYRELKRYNAAQEEPPTEIIWIALAGGLPVVVVALWTQLFY